MDPNEMRRRAEAQSRADYMESIRQQKAAEERRQAEQAAREMERRVAERIAEDQRRREDEIRRQQGPRGSPRQRLHRTR
jgi:hypothetical protein